MAKFLLAFGLLLLIGGTFGGVIKRTADVSKNSADKNIEQDVKQIKDNVEILRSENQILLREAAYMRQKHQNLKPAKHLQSQRTADVGKHSADKNIKQDVKQIKDNVETLRSENQILLREAAYMRQKHQNLKSAKHLQSHLVHQVKENIHKVLDDLEVIKTKQKSLDRKFDDLQRTNGALLKKKKKMKKKVMVNKESSGLTTLSGPPLSPERPGAGNEHRALPVDEDTKIFHQGSDVKDSSSLGLYWYRMYIYGIGVITVIAGFIIVLLCLFKK